MAAGEGNTMSATRFQILLQAHRNLDMADLLAENGDYAGAEKNMAAARKLIFGSTQQASPAQPKVAGTSNSGSSGARQETPPLA
jgi:hypothetical protein